MKIKHLINKLQQEDPEMEVYRYDDNDSLLNSEIRYRHHWVDKDHPQDEYGDTFKMEIPDEIFTKVLVIG